jgi:septal ring factor EnvC (AmiA/AmiB activator)
MKHFVALLVLAAFLAPAANAVSQARDPRVPTLQRRVANVERHVSTIERHSTDVDLQIGAMSRDLDTVREQVTSLQTAAEQLRTGINYVNDKDTCSTALTFDVFRVLIMGLGGGDIGRLDDKGACSRVSVTRP